MDKNSGVYVLGFAGAVCVVMAAGLAATFNGLKTRIDKNVLFDKQRNVLIACGLYDPASPKSQADLEDLFKKRVEVKVLEFFTSEVKTEYRERGEKKTRTEQKITRAEETKLSLAEMAKAKRSEPNRKLGEMYLAKGDDGRRLYCLPISGYGLWSTLYGFLALESDRNTVVGITFYKHGETPGLGGEVEKPWWQKNWKGRTTHDTSGNLVGITVLKGQGNDLSSQPHAVDGISGATITSNGVSKFVRADLRRYEPYFKSLNK
ncbi:MAG: NADH:ubiquinone reductase (Na(+)-transporting) subunit C [Planctomycetes bacterium]|nr:NADH:ubiquinone reductase (Na(+)-transporting) subunit C [Planctomycetota bacterium]